MITLIINGNPICLPSDTKIDYNKKIHDLASIESVNASFTTSFKLDKTPEVVSALQMLGYVGDTSSIPYSKVPASLQVDGITLIENGWLEVDETDDKYNVHLIDGIVDLFDALESKKLATDIPLPNLAHDKTVATVLASHQNDLDYKYLLGDYGGVVLANGDSIIPFVNIDYMVPSVRVKYILDSIFSYINYTYSGSVFSSPDFTDAFMTYSKSNSDILEEKLLQVKNEDFPSLSMTNSGEFLSFFTANVPWTIIDDNGGVIIYNETGNRSFQKFSLQENGSYNVKLKATGKVNYTIRFRPNPNVSRSATAPFRAKLFKNGAEIGSVLSNGEEDGLPISFLANQGDVLQIRLFRLGDQEVFDHLDIELPAPASEFFAVPEGVDYTSTEATINSVEFDSSEFTSTLSSWESKDFIKEVMWKFGLTPVIDNRSKHITFYTISELLNTRNAVDWSDKYISRDSEKYVYDNYGQANHLKHSYNETDATFSDGIFYVNNANLNLENEVLRSKFYSPSQTITPIMLNFNKVITVFKTPIYEKEVQEDEDGNIEVEYKGLDNRWYWLRNEQDTTSPLQMIFGSQVLGNEITYSGNINKVNTSFTTFNELVPRYYSDYSRILNNCRIHEIKLQLRIEDIHNLDFTKLYYFKQEAQYYKLNSLKWKSSNNTSTGEFIRVTPTQQ